MICTHCGSTIRESLTIPAERQRGLTTEEIREWASGGNRNSINQHESIVSEVTPLTDQQPIVVKDQARQAG